VSDIESAITKISNDLHNLDYYKIPEDMPYIINAIQNGLKNCKGSDSFIKFTNDLKITSNKLTIIKSHMVQFIKYF
jgi:isocitrate dehydrogenase kinase/phosphatase